jgi:hypothetical protein
MELIPTRNLRGIPNTLPLLSLVVVLLFFLHEDGGKGESLQSSYLSEGNAIPRQHSITDMPVLFVQKETNKRKEKKKEEEKEKVGSMSDDEPPKKKRKTGKEESEEKDDGKEEVAEVKGNKKFRRDKPWDTDDVDHWKVEEWKPGEGGGERRGGMLGVELIFYFRIYERSSP